MHIKGGDRMERVIFREEHNPYLNKLTYIAFFPDDEANAGKVGAIPFGYNGGVTYYEPYTEIDYGYMLKKKIVHKDDVRIPRLKAAIECRYNIKVEVVEKITKRK